MENTKQKIENKIKDKNTNPNLLKSLNDKKNIITQNKVVKK